MLKEIILINSARFDFARVRLEKDLFFLGDNGSGKTSFIRAIHFLYSGDVKSLGISNDKESFKEYYFKYENSYIIYLFEHFFIFVYKRGNELHKFFSKQPFDLAQITDEEGRLRPFEAIRSYLRSAPLHKRVSGVYDYSDILYGLNRKYLDFKIAEIRDKALFLRLFHAVFNVDKAIIDAKSIKKALMTSLDQSEEGKSFDPAGYIERINAFMEQYRFFNQIEKAGDAIEELEAVHKRLLRSEEELKRLSAKIRQRKQIESMQLQELGRMLEALRGQKERELQAQKSLKSFEEGFKALLDDRIDALRAQIAAIEGEKRRFSPEALNSARQRVREAAATEEEYERLYRDKMKLLSGIESASESLEAQIRALRRRIEEELPRQRRIEIDEAIRTAREREEERLEAERLKLAEFEERENLAIENERQAIERLQNRIEAEAKRLEEARESRHEALDSFRERSRLLQDELDTALRTLADTEAKIERKIARLQEQAEAVAETYAKKRAEAQAVYEEEKGAIAQEEAMLRQILNIEEGSFQAFLDEELEGWQTSLYPLLDPTLLMMPTAKLKPRILHRPAIGIALDTSELKHLPTPEEAQERLERLEARMQALQTRWEAKEAELQEKEARESAKIAAEIEEMRTRLAALEEEKRAQEREYEKRLAASEKEKEEALAAIAELEGQINERIAGYRSQIEELERTIRERQERIKRRQTQLRQARQKLRAKLERIAQKIEAEAREKELAKRVELEAQIKNLAEQKRSIQTDARLRMIEEELSALSERLDEIRAAKTLLEGYEAFRPKLRQEPALKERLTHYRSRRKGCLERIESARRSRQERLEEIRAGIEAAQSRIKRIEEGLKRLQNLVLFGPEDATESSKSDLLELIERLERGALAYEKDRTRMGVLLQRLSKIKGLAKQDIHLDLNMAENATYWSEAVPLHLQIENLVELKRFRIDTLKKSANAEFGNFVKNLISQQLTVFSNTQEAFEALVAKVNTQLRQVDFGVIRQIRLRTRVEEGDSLAKMFARLKSESDEIATLLVQDSLFFDRRDALRKLEGLLELFEEIKKSLKSDRISLVDTIDLSLEFYENGVLKSGITQIKNESSTGGSMLLKIAIAVAILKVYIKNAENIFFLIVDEVARLHSENQRRLKNFANESGFRIIFVTPEPVFADPEALLYYRFEKSGEKFRVIALNR